MSEMKTIAITSGKGGVGKTHLSVASSIEWARCGKRVILVDVDLNTPNSHIYLSVKNPKWTMKDVLRGKCSLEEALIEIPAQYWAGGDHPSGGSLHLLAGSVDGVELLEMSSGDHRQLQEILSDHSEMADILVFDTGAGVDHHLLFCCEYCQEVLVITNPEASARADAMKVLQFVGALESPPSRWLIPNLVEDQVAGRRLFDHFQRNMNDAEMRWAGAIREDRALRAAATGGKMVSVEEPGAIASGDIRNIARSILDRVVEETDGEFLKRIDDIIGA